MNVTVVTNNWTIINEFDIEAAYIALCCVLYFATLHWDFLKTSKQSSKRILFVTAHPDDECMFFGPTIIKYTSRKNCQVYLLCLSKGNADGLGATRTKELWNACMKLGIPSENIMLMNNTLLPDDPKLMWREDIIARLVTTRIEEFDIDMLVTFDKHGVSKHKNHCSIFYSIAYLCLDKKIPQYCTVYTLESCNIIRKYWLLFDIPLSYLLSSYRFILNWRERCQVVNAMYQHKSQLVWFRRLFMVFSRYTMINTLNQMNTVDLELDLEVDPDD